MRVRGRGHLRAHMLCLQDMRVLTLQTRQAGLVPLFPRLPLQLMPRTGCEMACNGYPGAVLQPSAALQRSHAHCYSELHASTLVAMSF